MGLAVDGQGNGWVHNLLTYHRRLSQACGFRAGQLVGLLRANIGPPFGFGQVAVGNPAGPGWPGLQVYGPENDTIIGATGGQFLVVRAEGQTANQISVADEGWTKGLARHHIPKNNTVISPTRG